MTGKKPALNTIKTLPFRIIVPALLSIVLITLAFYTIAIPYFEKTLIDHKKELVRELVNTAHSVLEEYAQREKSGELTRAQAQQRAKKRLYHMRYGKNNKDYFWINTMEPRMVMHPYRPDLEGKNLSYYKDPNGKALFVEAAALVAKKDSGFVEYMWQWKDDPAQIVKKISFVRGFAPWGWIVGSGIYIEDIHWEISLIVRRLALTLTVILGITIILIMHGILQGIKNDALKKAAEKKLLCSERKYRQLVQNANSIILRMDRSGNITFFNEFAGKFFGYIPEEILGRNVVGTIVPETDTSGRDLKKMIADLCARPNDYAGNENENIKKTGERVWVFWTNRLVAGESGEDAEILCVGNDITERKKAEQALGERETKFQMLFEHMTNGVIIQTPVDDGRDFIIQDINRAAEKLENIEKSAVIGKRLSEILPGGKDSRVIELLRQTWRSGTPRHIPENRYHDRQHGESWRESWIYTLPSGEVVSLMNDITEKKALEQEALRSARLASIGEIAAGVAHEVNNPLNGIINCAELISDTLSEKELDTRWADAIIRESRRIATLVKSLLSYARPRETADEPGSVKDILDETVLLTQKSFARDAIAISFEPADALPPVRLQRQKIQEVFMNIMANAHYSLNEKFGTETGKKQLKIKLFPTVSNHRACVRIVFEDNGTGIPQGSMDRICDPFFTLKPAGQGTGIGLNICYNIIQEHGGKLSFESREGSYTRVFVDLPAPDS